MKQFITPDIALAIVDDNPDTALATALTTAQEFAAEQVTAGAKHDITLSDTYLFDEPGLHNGKNGYEQFLAVADAQRSRGWVLSSALYPVNHLEAGTGLVLLQNGEVGTHFVCRINPELQRIYGRIGVRGRLIYDNPDGQSRARTVEMARTYRMSPSEQPKGAAAGLLATRIFLGLYQRDNYQKRHAA